MTTGQHGYCRSHVTSDIDGGHFPVYSHVVFSLEKMTRADLDFDSFSSGQALRFFNLNKEVCYWSFNYLFKFFLNYDCWLLCTHLINWHVKSCEEKCHQHLQHFWNYAWVQQSLLSSWTWHLKNEGEFSSIRLKVITRYSQPSLCQHSTKYNGNFTGMKRNS